MYFEILKSLVLLGIVGKSLASRFWIGALVAASVLYVGVGLFALLAFEVPWPLLSTFLGERPSQTAVLAILGLEIVATLLVWQVGARFHAAGTAPREAADLMFLPAAITVAQIGFIVLLT